MRRLTRWLSLAAAAWYGTLDRFDQVHPPERITLGGAASDDDTGTVADV